MLNKTRYFELKQYPGSVLKLFFNSSLSMTLEFVNTAGPYKPGDKVNCLKYDLREIVFTPGEK